MSWFAQLFESFWVAYFTVKVRYESATLEIAKDENETARDARIGAHLRGVPASDRPPR